MVPVIPQQRTFATKGKPFNALNAYIQGEKEQAKGKSIGQGAETGKTTEDKWADLPNKFNDILNYSTNKIDQDTNEEKCIAILTHGITDLATASIEMNAVAEKNRRVKDPAYHFILSWPEHEVPNPDTIFDAATHAIAALGLAEHQYVIAVHGNTDNMHCHISVNRVHPQTFASRNIEWSEKTLHKAARESEIKHNWTHDNGLWIVEQDGHGKKHVVINPDHANAFKNDGKHAHREQSTEALLPTWHDPESLEAWLKEKVSKALTRQLPKLDGWPALHAWLSTQGIALKDTGGGGMRLELVSTQTGEVLEIAASKGLRNLKRADLEKRWGAFQKPIEIPCQVTDLTHLTPQQIQKGIDNVLNRSTLTNPELGKPPDHVLRHQQSAARDAAEGGGSVHELPAGGLDDERKSPRSLLPNAVPGGMADTHTGHNNDVRRTGAGEGGGRSQRRLTRDDTKREASKAQRALARADLRTRFAQYKRFVSSGDTHHYLRTKAINAARKFELDQLKLATKQIKQDLPKTRPAAERLADIIDLDALSLRKKLEVEAKYQGQLKELKATRLPPLGWREWLYEQSNLGDKAAVSALRGIVYQAQRDAKKEQSDDQLEISDATETDEEKYRKAMARLLEEEKREAAIRSADHYRMRPFEADVLLQQYRNIQWNVTGNGNIEYRGSAGNHLFTDRGSRVTFDKVLVTDDEIRLALAHSQQKFGDKVILTGDDQAFSQRMARLADDMGLTVLNPELQATIQQHREDRKTALLRPTETPPTPNQVKQPTTQATQPGIPSNPTPTEPLPSKTQPVHDATADIQDKPNARERTQEDQLRDKVLAIDPRATFKPADTEMTNTAYIGPVAASLENDEAAMFAQHQGRSVYVIHAFKAPNTDNDATVEIAYRNGAPTLKLHEPAKGKTR